MTKEQMNREMAYQGVMRIFRKMLEDGVMTTEEFRKIETKMREKLLPVFSGL